MSGNTAISQIVELTNICGVLLAMSAKGSLAVVQVLRSSGMTVPKIQAAIRHWYGTENAATQVSELGFCLDWQLFGLVRSLDMLTTARECNGQTLRTWAAAIF